MQFTVQSSQHMACPHGWLRTVRGRLMQTVHDSPSSSCADGGAAAGRLFEEVDRAAAGRLFEEVDICRRRVCMSSCVREPVCVANTVLTFELNILYCNYCNRYMSHARSGHKSVLYRSK